MKLILNSVKYRGRSRTLNFELDDDTVISGNRELKIMKRQKKQYGTPLR